MTNAACRFPRAFVSCFTRYPVLAKYAKLCHSLNLISGSRWPKAVAKSCGGHIQSIPHVIQAVANLSSCGGHIQSIPHVIQAVANLSSYSLDSKRLSILGKDGFRVSSMGVSNRGEKFFFISPRVAGCRRVDMFYVPLPFRASVQAFSKKCGVFGDLRCFVIEQAGLIG